MAGNPGPDFGYDATHRPRDLTGTYSSGKWTGSPGFTDFDNWELADMMRAIAPLKDGFYAAAAAQWRSISQRLTSMHTTVNSAGNTLLPQWDPTVSDASAVFFEMVGASTWSINEWITVADSNAAALDRMAKDLASARTQMETIYSNFQKEWNSEINQANYYYTPAGMADMMKANGLSPMPDVSPQDWAKRHIDAANAAKKKYTAQAAKVMKTLGGSFRDNAGSLTEGDTFQGPTQAVNPIAALGQKVTSALGGGGLPGGVSPAQQIAAQQRAISEQELAAQRQLTAQRQAAQLKLAQQKAAQQEAAREQLLAQQQLTLQQKLAAQQQAAARQQIAARQHLLAQQQAAAQQQLLAQQQLVGQRQLVAQQQVAAQEEKAAQEQLAAQRQAAQQKIAAQQQIASQEEAAAQQNLAGQQQAAQHQIAAQQQLVAQEEAAARQQLAGGLGAGPLAGRLGGFGAAGAPAGVGAPGSALTPQELLAAGGGAAVAGPAGGVGSALTPQELLAAARGAAGAGGMPGFGLAGGLPGGAGMPGGAAGSLLGNAARLAGSQREGEADEGRGGRASPLGQEPLSGRRRRDSGSARAREALSPAQFRENREDYITEMPTAPQVPIGRLLADGPLGGQAGTSAGPALSGRAGTQAQPPQSGLPARPGLGGSELSGRRRRAEERDEEPDESLLTGEDFHYGLPSGDLEGRNGAEAIDLDTAAAALAAADALGGHGLATPVAALAQPAAGAGRSEAAAAALAPAEVPDAVAEEEWTLAEAATPAPGPRSGPAPSAQPGG